MAEWNLDAKLVPYAQELNPETYAISVADKLIQGYDVRNLKLGNTLSDDQLPGERFDYCLANPPFGVKWEIVQKLVNAEHTGQGYAGRFGPGLPRVGDGSLLFLMHLLSKRKPAEQGGTRIGIVLSGSPLFNGGAGSGESEIRRWILENDWLEAIVALPTDLFYNTGIGTYVWVLSNHKAPARQGKVQLIDASGQHSPMRKSLGSKRKTIAQAQIEAIAHWHDDFADGPHSKLFDTADFGYRRITVERPLRLRFEVTAETLKAYAEAKGSDQVERFATLAGRGAFDSLDAFLAAAGVKKLGKATRKAVLDSFGIRDPAAQPVTDADGQPVADTELREFENVPLKQDIRDYFAREVLPHVPDAWIDEGKTDPKDGGVGVVGYEINFNRYFYTYVPPRPLEAIDADLKAVESEIAALLNEVTSLKTAQTAAAQRPTSLAWLHKIPCDWVVLSLARVTLARCDGPFGSAIKSEHYVDGGVAVVRLQNIGSAAYKVSDPAYLDEAYVRDEIGDGHWVEPGDILIAGLGDENNPLGRACAAPESLGPAIVKADCYRFRLNTERADPAFVALQLSALAQAECGFLATGSTRQRLNLGLASSRYLALPPGVAEQTRITDWLDRETARIDALIEKKTRFIELLHEKRQALITQAVTRGLDPSVPLKESDVPQVGGIPGHWKMERVKFLAESIKAGPFGSALTKDTYSPSGLRVYGQEQVIAGDFSIGDYYIDEDTADEFSQYRVRAGDVLISCVGTFGKIATVPPDAEPGIINPRLIRLRPSHRVSSEYLETVLRSRVVFEQFEQWSRGGTMDVINVGTLSNVSIPLPPPSEQQALLAHLATATARLDALAEATSQSILLLKERRAALITAAVTGQIDVREAA